MQLVKSKATCITWVKTLNYVQLKIKCIFHRGMRIYFISRKTSNLKHIDVGKKRVHIYV